jgi:O-antigen/teichoic acid export membrane protein
VSGNFRYVTTSVDKVLGPLFHRELRDSRQNGVKIKQIVNVLALAYLAIGFLGGIWMKEVFHLLIKNPELVSSYTIAIIILFSFATRPLYNGAQSFLFYNERTKNLWKVTFMSGVLNILLNVIFIPIYGITAAAVNTFICIAASHYGIFLLKDIRDLSTVDFRPVRWIVVTLVIFLVTWKLKDARILVKTSVTLGAAVASFFTYLYYKRKRKSEAFVLRS